MPCNIEKTKRISYYIDILFHIFASLHNIFYVLECMRLQKDVAEYATLRQRPRCSIGETAVLLHHSQKNEYSDQTCRLACRDTETVQPDTGILLQPIP